VSWQNKKPFRISILSFILPRARLRLLGAM